MTGLPSYNNRSVFAQVRVADEHLSDAYVEQSFEAYGWHHENVGASYILVVPLYCARSVALQEARRSLRKFSERYVPLLIDELRLLQAPADTRQIVSVTKAAGGLSSLIPQRIQNDSETALNPLQWQASIPRLESQDLRKRREWEETTAGKVFAESKLPGEKFNPATMKITTLAGPRKTVHDPWMHPARSLGFIGTALLTIVLALTGATLPWLEHLPGLLRIGAPALAAFLVGGGGWWLTGNRLKLLPRFVAVGTATVIIASFGWMIAQALKYNEVLSLPSALTIIAILVLLFLSITGWIHLAILHPKIRRFWSIPAVTSLVAAAIASPRFIWGQEQILDSIGGSAVLPVWLHTATALYVLIAVIAIGLCVGGFAGWLAYFGVTTGSFYEQTALYLLLAITTLLLALLALLGLLANLNTMLDT